MELNKTIAFYFRQPGLENVSIPELQKAISRFPYCASLQYLLLSKQKMEQDPGFEKQLNTTHLYFPNTFWLHSLLEEPVAREEKTAEPGYEKGIERVIEPVFDGAFEKETKIETEIVADPESESESRTESVIHVETEPKTEEWVGTQINIESEEVHPIQDVTVSPEPALRTDLLLKESPIPIPSLKDISPQSDELPIFEPYHTIDYFASQGIKLSRDLPVNDRLGRQLRSFTDWIKTMKKLPQAELESKLDEAGMGEKIQAMAAGSVVAHEILTETMAEVLEKQGNFSGAMEIYHKLSLAHPDKSVYFAARIEHLKKLR